MCPTKVQPYTQCSFMVTSPTARLSMNDCRRHVTQKRQSKISWRAINFFLEWLFEVYLESLLASPILFTKNMVVAYACRARNYIVHPCREVQNSGQRKKHGAGTYNSWITTTIVGKCGAKPKFAICREARQIIFENQLTETISNEMDIDVEHYKHAAKQEWQM